ncbi:1-acyl-sn-glycerol-3-phosphate acyltransferase [Salinimicrobium catena]|uniref:1-acyl-sn-glycerol-3-phosphate acyltransferase n=1 Tax=Salinimicrobium catena TaxID=390640 RepID=A0A1H5IC09_9FLAO|nr:lysophospholipid acyltransferase family protein [Salinimicrobium catena]SDK76507.1 1-acyl-sn-glycerol-3-phosphate acyltransferase [Salinimicrobium catena]SEE37736.1 1-acyl-sn-glycerol-3-phosphate acyltransferase [Salinimicrobium catena]
MRILRIFLVALWRVWFYILMGVPIILFLPLLLLFTSRTKFYPQFFILARWWAFFILFGMGFLPKIKREQKLKKGESYMLVANHTSMTDIMLMLVTVRNPFVFVGKKELVKIPLFGYFYKRTCILVDRGNQRSRKEVFERAQRRLNEGTSICIFPEGGVPDDLDVVLDTFKDGAFRLAIDHQIPIVPMIFYDNKKRFPYVFSKGSPGRMRVKVKKFIFTEGKTQDDKKFLREETREVILNELEKGRF